MKLLHIVIPDLFLPEDIVAHACSGLQLPVLEKILARSSRDAVAVRGVEEFLCDRFGVSAAAPVRALADGLDVRAELWMCADPVNLQLQQSQVVLRPDVQCTADEAAVLSAALNKHFAEDGLTFFAPHPQRWYVRFEKESSVNMTPLRRAAWRDVKAYLPQGVDALYWQRLANEIQMLLHDHAINIAREAQRLPAINSVWMWGGGRLGVLHPAFSAVGGDDTLCAAFARVAAVPLAGSLADMLDMQGQLGLWVNTSLGQAWQRGDLYGWREAAKTLELEIAQPVWRALHSGRVQIVTLDVPLESGTRRFILTRAGLWKVWSRPKSLAGYVV